MMGQLAEQLRASLKTFATKQTTQERLLVQAMLERTREMLSDGPFEVSSNGTFIRVVARGGRGGSMTLMQGLMWRAPYAVDERLRLIFESFGARLQEFVSRSTDAPWPGSDAHLRVTVSDESVSMEWEDVATSRRIFAMRPITRAEFECTVDPK